MQKDINTDQKSNGPGGIRVGVWFFFCGLLLMCLILIMTSGHQTSRPATATNEVTRRGSDLTPSSIRPTRRTTPPPSFAEAPTTPTLLQADPVFSNELTSARGKLTDLRKVYGDEHPEVKEQIRAVESLERSGPTPGETVELARARADLAKLEVRFGPDHPEREAQRRFVESLEQSAAAGESSDLAQAKAKLASLRASYGEGHPEVRSQLEIIAKLQQ